jgi:hypothetical protein
MATFLLVCRRMILKMEVIGVSAACPEFISQLHMAAAASSICHPLTGFWTVAMSHKNHITRVDSTRIGHCTSPKIHLLGFHNAALCCFLRINAVLFLFAIVLLKGFFRGKKDAWLKLEGCHLYLRLHPNTDDGHIGSAQFPTLDCPNHVPPG